MARAHERTHGSRESFILPALLVLVAFEFAIYFQHAVQSGDFSVTRQARERQQNYDDCVSQYLFQHGDTPGNRAIAHGLCFINLLL